MQNWDAMQPTANYDQHNSWYNNMFAANIKTEPGTFSPTSLHHSHHNQTPTTPSTSSQLESYLKQQHQQHHHMMPMDTMTTMTPSPSNNESSLQHYFDTNAMQQQLIQQQQYQQQFQQAQQAAAQNQVTTTTASTHMPLGFNPLTPPGLPTAVLPSMTHFYNQTNLARNNQQTPSPQSPADTTHLATPIEANDKLQSSALTPRNTPPMDITPPKSPKSANMLAATQQQPIDSQVNEKDQDLVSNSSEDMKYMGESEDDESIRMPIYNSHGKMKNYKCKTCGVVAITKVSFWEHVRSHMKPEKILQCPKCPFVTELKHHLEYHIRKHKNIKPFQCDKCSYTCVNKSMLNSHRKSHSSVYQYRCSDCDYATKYCHSFKLHLRKYDHKPGLVLDEEGLPNPSIVIDVYGTRRGPKSKSGTTSSKRNSDRGSTKNQQSDIKPPTSQLSAALQGFSLPQHQMPASPAKSTSSSTSDVPALNIKMQHQKLQSKFPSSGVQPNQPQQTVSNLLPPLASILQQNRNMAFFPYWNLNLQVLAAQQQAAVLAQLSPRMRESALQQLQLQNQHNDCQNNESGNEDDADENDDEDFDRKSVDSAMDLSQGTPIKEEPLQTNQHTPGIAINLKLQEETNDTPLLSSVSSSRRKGRVLKLDMLLQAKSASQSPESNKDNCTNSNDGPRTITSPSLGNNNILTNKNEENTSSLLSDESMDMAHNNDVLPSAANASPTNQTSANTSASSTASSSGNSSNSSASSTNSSGPLPGTMFECKYCDIYFKDAVLYTIHMGYHSCDDVFKCNMCGERCDGPVGLFVHMARNAHS